MIEELYTRFKGEETMTEHILINLLRQVKEVLDKHNIEFWLECGTLLGAVRNGKFIPWEHDIDLGAWQEKMTDVIKTSILKELCSRNFAVKVFENYIHIGGETVHTDINLYHISNDKAIILRQGPKCLKDRILYYVAMVLVDPYNPGLDFRELSFAKRLIKGSLFKLCCVLPSRLRKQLAQIAMAVYKKIGVKDVSWVIPSDYFMNLSTIKFYGMEFKVPNKIEEYLAYRYGEDWKTPKRNWRTNTDDGAVRIR